jgi:macrolide transport system ATP-binding/permease protein
MASVREWVARLSGTLRGRRDDGDLEEELRSHLELAAEEPRREAGPVAGGAGVAQAMEALRDQRGLPWADDFARDVRHSARLLRRDPVFTAVAVLSLALGIGANSAIFSLADEVILRPLPVPDLGAVVSVSEDGSEDAFAGGAMSYPNYRDLRDRARSFDGLAACRLTTVAFSRSRDASRDVRTGTLVSDNFFAALGVRPSMGRVFSSDEARVPGRDAVVVLSDDFWRGTLGADPSVLNGAVWLNGVEFHVVGIAPASFTGTEWPVRPAFYVPAVMESRLHASREGTLEKRDVRAFQVKGRLTPRASRASAQAELTTLWGGLARQFPEANAHRTIGVRTELEARVRSDPWDANLVAFLGVLAVIVLVIACANVASLMLGRVRSRSREVAIRLALGVSRSRLVRQLLTESLLLSLMGCGVGLAFAYGGIRFLQTIPVGDQIVIAPRLDLRVVLFSLVAAVASACLFGLGPARRSLGTDLVPALKTLEPLGKGRQRTIGRDTLVIAQVAMSMVLLVAAAVLLDGFRKALVLDPGFRTDHLAVLSLDPSLVGYTPEQTRTFYRDLVNRARSLPSVRSAALIDAVPLQPGQQDVRSVVPEGYQFPQGQQGVTTFAAVVDEHYFDTMRVGILHGRAFTAADAAGARAVAIVNEEFATTYWPGQGAIGKRLRLPEEHGGWLEIVGIARTGKYTWIGERPIPFLYLPFAQQARTRMSLLVESETADAAGLASPLREVVRALDVGQPVSSVTTFARLYRERAIAVPMLIMETVGSIGLLGLVLTLIGLYGLVAYSVARRTREIGIRMAIGAARGDVLSMVLRQGIRLSLIGIALGGLVSVAVARVLAGMLVGLGTPNPLVYGAVPAVLVGLTAAASYIPARRAARVDPLLALRCD